MDALVSRRQSNAGVTHGGTGDITPINSGQLAEVLVLRPVDRIVGDAPSSDAPAQPDGNADAATLQARLASEVRAFDQRPQPQPEFPAEWVAPGEALKPDAVEVSASKPRKTAWRIAKTLVALAAVVALGWTPLQRALETTSAEAVVNARLVTLRAPIDGTITVPRSITGVGETITSKETLLDIKNPRADRSQLDDLRRQVADLQAERSVLMRRKTQFEGLQVQLRKQRDAFQKGRVEQLEARAAELAAGIAAADAKADETLSTLDRTKKLKVSGYQSQAAVDRAERDHKVAVNTAVALRQKLVGTQVELDAAKTGLFVGDSYNDIPRTAQRLDEITQQVIDLGGQIDEKTLRISQLQTDLAQEEKQFALRSAAALTASVSGRIWEMLTSDGEEVSRGQDLMRLLDCGGVLVTAAVSESVYNKLRLGQPASFHLRGESAERAGRVVSLNGLASVAANMAIEQDALGREPYHVTLEVPSLVNGPDCYLGRTGKVTFDTRDKIPGTDPGTSVAKL